MNVKSGHGTIIAGENTASGDLSKVVSASGVVSSSSTTGMSFVTGVCVIIKLASPAAPEDVVDEDEYVRPRGGIGAGSCCNTPIPPAVAEGVRFEARGELRELLLRGGFFRIAEARPSGIPSSSSPFSSSYSSSTSKIDEEGKSSEGDFEPMFALAPCSLLTVVGVEAGYRNPPPPLPLLVLREAGSARNGMGGVELIELNTASCGPELVWRLGESAARPPSPPAFELTNGEGARERDREEVRLPREWLP
jgi:hypothetical protein